MSHMSRVRAPSGTLICLQVDFFLAFEGDASSFHAFFLCGHPILNFVFEKPIYV